MKLAVPFLAAAVSLLAQQPGGRGVPEPKNLKLLSPKSDIMLIMRGFNEALGVQCTYCHVQNDFAADTNPKKEMARKMISMARIIGDSFPSSAGEFPDGYHEVDCMTCHRGSTKPKPRRRGGTTASTILKAGTWARRTRRASA